MDRTHALPITRQAQLLGISRSNVYYRPVAASGASLSRTEFEMRVSSVR
jgi:hypothetical protein